MIKKSHIWVIDKSNEIYSEIAEHGGFQISFCNSYNEAEEIISRESLNFDLVLIDISTKNINAWEFIAKIRLNHNLKRIPIILTSDLKNESLLVSGLKLGADDYVCKPFNIVTLTAKIEASLRRLSWSEEDLKTVNSSENAGSKDKLTIREKEILELIGKGKSNRQIAEILYLSELTVKTHLKNIFKKMQVANRTQAILTAISKGLIDNSLLESI